VKKLAESVKKQEKEITQRKTVEVARKQGKKEFKKHSKTAMGKKRPTCINF
jgi:hypothetical protein